MYAIRSYYALQDRITIYSYTDKVMLNFTGEDGTKAHLYITDISGRLVEERDIIAGGTVEVNMKEGPGVYIASLVSKEQKISKKILITR